MTTYPLGMTVPMPASQPFGAIAPGEWSPPPTPLAQPPIDEDALRQQAAALLQHVYRWLDATAPVEPRVLDVVPMLVTAVQLYEAQEYLDCRQQVAAVAGVLQQARSTIPGLPPL